MRRRILLALAALELIFATLFAYGYYRWAVEWHLNGFEALAKVTSLRQTDAGLTYVTYTFSPPGGGAYTREHRITPQLFAALQLGQDVLVVYSPLDPAFNGIPGQIDGDFDLPTLPGTFFSLGFMIYVLPVLIVLTAGAMFGVALYRPRPAA